MFIQMNTKELIEYVKNFKFKRNITQWHIHHTWSPNYGHFKGDNHQALQQGMKNYHVNTQKWSDIAQHFSLFPDGVWLLGRDLNVTPASITGWNTGALCVEMIGNFDKGHDIMTDAQKEAILEVSSFMTKAIGLEMKFHRDSPTAGKSCPGTGIDRDEFFKAVEAWGRKIEAPKTRELKDWEKKVFEECLKNGIITNKSWLDIPDEKMDVVHTLAMLNNMFNIVKGNSQ